MKNQITSFKELYIPKPCHQDWDEMSSDERGKFCENCKKVVFDFTKKTEADFNLLYKLNKGNICGRFGDDQIDQDYVYIANAQVSKGFLTLKKYCSILIAFIVLKLSSIRSAFSQQTQIPTETSFGNSAKIILPASKKANGTVNGKVENRASGYGLVGFSVRLYDSKKQLIAETISDDSGKFVIELPDTLRLNQKFVISVDKEKSKVTHDVIKYSSGKKEIFEKEFGNVVFSVKVHRRIRRDLLGRKRKFMGCPKFR